MKYFHVAFFSIICSVFVLFASGCRFGPALPPDLPKLYPCTLTFTQEGQPLEGAMVMLTNTVSSKWSSAGITDKNGKVELYVNGKYKGVPKGKYKITAMKIYSEASQAGPPLEEGDPGYEQWRARLSQEKLKTYSVVDKKYGDVESSPLEIEVPGKIKSFDLGGAVMEEPPADE